MSAAFVSTFEPEKGGAPYHYRVVSPDLVRHIVEKSVTAVFRVPAEALRAPTRGRAQTALARQVAMYLAHVACGLPLKQVGELFGRDRTTVAHACGQVEDRRDDPRFDRVLDHLEEGIGRLILAMRKLDRAA